MRDLFGEVPVTIRDVELWLDRIVNFRGSALRVAYYVLNWNVVDKIRAAKLDGSWQGLLEHDAAYRPFDFRHRRLCLRVAYLLDQETADFGLRASANFYDGLGQALICYLCERV